MYAVGHTSQKLFSLNDTATAKIKERRSKCKKRAKDVYYRTVIKNEIFSFVETYEEEQVVISMLFLGGAGA